MFGGVVALAAVIVLVAVLVSRGGDDDGGGSAAAANPVALFDGIPQDGPWLGRPDAPVVVEEYVDLQCPFCRDFSLQDLPSIIQDEVRTGRVRMRLRIVSILGPESVNAAQMAGAARLQDRGWQFTEAFFAEQGSENSGYVTGAFLRERADEAGLDVERALRDRQRENVQRALDRDQEAFLRAELSGTPAFRVGPRGGTLSNFDATQLRAAIAAAANDS